MAGLFNCGTGRAQPFNDVAHSVVNTLRVASGQPTLSLSEMVEQGFIRYIPFPEDLKGRYQSHTQADLSNLRAAGYEQPFKDVQTGVAAYVNRLLEQGRL